MLYYLYIASLYDETARIVSISHASLCMRLIFLNSYLHFVCWPSTSFLRTYGHLFGVRMCTFHSALLRLLLLFSPSHLVTVHINTNRHDIPSPFPFFPYPSFLRVAFVLIDPCTAARMSVIVHSSSVRLTPDLLLVQYNITILGGPSVAQVNVVSSSCAEKVRELGRISTGAAAWARAWMTWLCSRVDNGYYEASVGHII
jgi:hypothetical protein